MVTIIGNVKPEDDYTHPLGPEENFNESVYFNFFDRSKRMGGFMRIGNRANEGHAEMTVIVYQPDGSALFNYKRPQISSNDGWDAGGLKVEVIEPAERIRTTYEGSVVYLADPREMREPGDAFKKNPHKRIKLDLLHEGVGPLYGHVAEASNANAQNDFARAHYEQHMKVARHAANRGRRARRDHRPRPAGPLLGAALLAVDAIVPLAHRQLRRRHGHGHLHRRQPRRRRVLQGHGAVPDRERRPRYALRRRHELPHRA